MRQFTTEQQTAKLIELGFKKPPKKGLLFQSKIGNCLTDLMLAEENYSIGELIKLLDSVNETVHCRFGGVKANLVSTNSGYEKIGGELIDLLFDLCVKLKEDGVI